MSLNRHQRRAATSREKKATGLSIVGQEFSRRSCGECSACCTWLAVEAPQDIAHERGCDCPKLAPLDGPKRCSVHALRPMVCRNFECLWLQGFEGDEYRPDRCGFIMRIVENAPEVGGGRVHFDEITPGALKSEIGLHAQAVVGSQVFCITIDVEGNTRMNFPIGTPTALIDAFLKSVKSAPTDAH